jgi:hypothetical protein
MMGRNEKQVRQEDAKWRQYAQDAFDEAIEVCDSSVKHVLLYSTGPDFVAGVARLANAKLIDDAVNLAVATAVRRIELVQELAIHLASRMGNDMTDVLFVMSQFNLLFRHDFVETFSKRREALSSRPTSRLSRAIYALESPSDDDEER